VPAKFPPTFPPLALNSSMTAAFQSLALLMTDPPGGEVVCQISCRGPDRSPTGTLRLADGRGDDIVEHLGTRWDWG
jgi:hypothetical protein